MEQLINTEALRFIREAKGWDQRTLALKSGVNPSVISRMERGLQVDFKVSVLIALSKALQTPIDSLLIAPYQPTPLSIPPELSAILQELMHLPEPYRHQAVAILQTYLATMPASV